jgi:hypothetical protein
MTVPQFRNAVHQHDYSTLHGGQGPPTGIGGFDVQYAAATNELLITTKMHMTYQPAPGGGAAAWTTSSKTSFENAFKKKAAEFWSKKRAFRCTLANFTGFSAVPRIKVEFVGSSALAHFDVLVYPGSGQSHLEQDGSLVLYSLDVHSNYERKKKQAATDPTCKWYQKKYKWARQQVAQSASVAAVLMSEASKVRQGLAPSSRISFAPGSSALAGTETGKVNAIANLIGGAHPDDPRFPLVITGYHTPADGAGVGSGRARACVQALQKAGVKREMETAVTQTTDPNLQNSAKVDIDDSIAALPNLILKAQYKYNYTIAIHEVGHVSACPTSGSCTTALDTARRFGTRIRHGWRSAGQGRRELAEPWRPRRSG